MERKEKRTLTKYVSRGSGDLHLILMLSFVGVVCWMSLWCVFSSRLLVSDLFNLALSRYWRGFWYAPFSLSFPVSSMPTLTK